jgi:hypothetical protein
MRSDGPLLTPRTPKALPPVKTGPQQVCQHCEWNMPVNTSRRCSRTASAAAAAATAWQVSAWQSHIPCATDVLQARRRQRIVRSTLVVAALLAVGHYVSLLVRVQSCRGSSAGGSSISDGGLTLAPSRSAASTLVGGLRPAAGADALQWAPGAGSRLDSDGDGRGSGGVGSTDQAAGAAWDPHVGGRRGIPRILHQSWKDEHVPERFHKWQVRSALLPSAASGLAYLLMQQCREHSAAYQHTKRNGGAKQLMYAAGAGQLAAAAPRLGVPAVDRCR